MPAGAQSSIQGASTNAGGIGALGGLSAAGLAGGMTKEQVHKNVDYSTLIILMSHIIQGKLKYANY